MLTGIIIIQNVVIADYALRQEELLYEIMELQSAWLCNLVKMCTFLNAM